MKNESTTQKRLASGFDIRPFTNQGPFISSIGDLGRLNIFTDYLPTEAQADKTIVVKDVICGLRMHMPPIMNLVYQYNGELSCHFYAASEFTTADALKVATDTFEEMVASVIGMDEK